MANILQIKRKAALAGALPFNPTRVNLSQQGGANNEYVAGDKVIYQGNYYVALANNDAMLPTTGAPYWSLMGAVAESPASMLAGELAFSEGGDVLYIGKQSSIGGVGGSGRLTTTDTTQSVAGNKTFTDFVALSTASTVTQPTSADDTLVATTEFVQNVFSVLDGGNFDDGSEVTPSGTGKYWYSTSNTSWFTVGNWYTDVTHLQPAANLPDASTDVITLGSIEPIVNLDNAAWVQPNSIDATATGITFTSQLYATVTCEISGEATFNGNSIFGP